MKNFFEHQEKAKNYTFYLLLCCLVTTIITALTVSHGVLGLFLCLDNSEDINLYSQDYHQAIVLISCIVVFIICCGSLYKIFQLSKGGKVVAKLLGGTLIPTDTQDPKLKMVLNVVEEMAIASSIQTPPVYYLPKEAGINAFAAGFSTEDAIVAVTQGCIDNLSRDELQGVIAHEFSHIFNGDMRLNIRLMGLVHGFLLLYLIGWSILRFMPRTRKRDSDSKSGALVFIVAVALLLIVLGSISAFLGNIIKASISRQREFLADATAVQYTRNPEGIGGALKKIQLLAEGSEIKAPHAKEASHMFFSNNFNGLCKRLLATHPPLEERIQRILTR
ncbi:MAG: M48 family metallopeptidase [Bdellovibrionota bacterium]|jgi:Zn-dependent protease with chaperone function